MRRVAAAVLAALLLATFPAIAAPIAGAPITTVTPPPKPLFRQLGAVSFYDYAPGSSGQDQTTDAQNFLLYAQMQWYRAKSATPSTGLDDQLLQSCMTAIFPKRISLASPLVVPPQVCTDPNGFQLADHATIASGAITDAYTGDTTSKALANQVQPMLLFVSGSRALGMTQTYPHNGTDSSSGVWFNKSWKPATAVLFTGGVRYTAGDVLRLGNPNNSPFLPAQIIVDTVLTGGVVTAHLDTSQPGTYALPPILQQVQWTAANGFTGAVANKNFGQVFDTSNAGVYVAACVTCADPTATGAEFTLTWTPDFVGGQYDGGSCPQTGMVFDNLQISGAGTTLNGTYGAQFGWSFCGLEIWGDHVVSQGGYYSSWIRGTDVHIGFLNPILAPVLLKAKFASSVDIGQLTLDTPSLHYAEISGVNGFVVGSLRCFHNGDPNTAQDASILIGADGSVSTGISITGECANAGSETGMPLLSLENVRSSTFNISSSNLTRATPVGQVSYPNNALVTVGSNVSAVTVHGSIDGTMATRGIIGQVSLGSDFRVWNSNARTMETGADYAYATNALNNPLALNSSQWSTINSPTITDFSTTAPDNTKTASTVNFTSGSLVRQTFTATSGASICASTYAKGGTLGSTILQVGNSTSSIYFRAQYTGTLFSSITNATALGGTITGYGSTPVGNGWVQLWVEGTVPSANPQVFLESIPTTTGTVSFWGTTVQVTPNRCPVAFRTAAAPPMGSTDAITYTLGGYTYGGNSHFSPVIAQTTVAVSTSPVAVAVTPADGANLTICGSDGTNKFCDTVRGYLTATPRWTQDNYAGSPADRTYTSDGAGGILAAVASGTYAVNAVGLVAGQR